MKTKNVFQIGKEAVGGSFIGRKREVWEVKERALSKGVYRALSIVGLTRVGKSSLVTNAVNASEANQNGIIYIKMVLSEYPDFISFWKAVIWKVQKQVERYFKIDDDIMREEFRRVSDCPVSEESYMIINTAFKEILLQLNTYEIPILMIIDEFDWARKMFHENQSYFEMFRTIASSAEFMMNIILISRRSLHIIEKCAPENSTFHGVFERKTVNGFSDQDIEEYFGVLAEYGIVLSEQEKEQLFFYCGNIPYLLSIFGHDMVEETLAGREISIPDIFEQNCVMIRRYYEDIQNQLVHDKLAEPLLRILTKGTGGYLREEWMALENIGVIDQREGGHTAVCPSFTEYFLKRNGMEKDIPAYSFHKEAGEAEKAAPSVVVQGDQNKIQIVGGDNRTVRIDHNTVNEMEALITALNELKKNATEEEKKELDQAIAAAKKRDSKKLHPALEKIAQLALDTASGIAAGVVVEYMKSKGIMI